MVNVAGVVRTRSSVRQDVCDSSCGLATGTIFFLVIISLLCRLVVVIVFIISPTESSSSSLRRCHTILFTILPSLTLTIPTLPSLNPTARKRPSGDQHNSLAVGAPSRFVASSQSAVAAGVVGSNASGVVGGGGATSESNVLYNMLIFSKIVSNMVLVLYYLRTITLICVTPPIYRAYYLFDTTQRI